MLHKSERPLVLPEFDWCKNIWNIKTAPKLKDFLWKVVRKAIPVSSNLATRGFPPFNCKTCDTEEDDLHVFLLCSVADNVWNLAPMSSRPSPSTPSIAALLIGASAHTVLPPVGLYIPLWPWILWNLWKARNKLCFENITFSGMEILAKSIADAKEWQFAQEIEPSTSLNPTPNQPTSRQYATTPAPDTVICNVDAAWDAVTRRCGNSSREKRKRVKKNPKPVPQASVHSSCYVGSVSDSSLKHNKLYLGREFVAANGLNKGCSEIVLKNEGGGRWTLPLKHYKSINHTYLGPGWTTFCQVNGIKAEDSFMFKLVRTGDKPVLCLCPEESSHRDKTPLECPEDSDDVNPLSSSTCSGDKSSKSKESKEESLGDKRASSSYSEDRFLTLTLTQKAVKRYQLFLPMGFAKRNGINKPGKITLLGQDGVKQEVALMQNKRTGQIQIGKGWRVFRDAHGLKIGHPFVLELIWEDEASPVLKFCTKH
ncbi:hypothetical protein Bca52824_072598 [Brassica carinata]|uniref:TF-B3 domain-containing protein n=1 Tax=Brassica carinata TaxID=52824 RepID=A0A8X7Q8A8_BRACI|nr:hypothetical protein Bca52824_072598 [Brassica carinata]